MVFIHSNRFKLTHIFITLSSSVAYSHSAVLSLEQSMVLEDLALDEGLNWWCFKQTSGIYYVGVITAPL